MKSEILSRDFLVEIRAAAIGVALALLAGLPVAAQTNEQPVDDFKPSSLNQPNKQFPQVNSEGRVRTRVVAPQATSVLLDIGAVKYPLTKGEDGAWIGESKPQDEGFHYYQIWVDGAAVPDPGSLYIYGEPAVGVAASKFRRRTPIFMPSRMFHMADSSILISIRRATMRTFLCSCTRPPITIRTLPNAIPFCICSTAAAKTKVAGALKVMPI